MSTTTNRTPVLIGIGTATQHGDDPAALVEPIQLMQQALQQAIGDTGNPSGVVPAIDRIAVPHGRWSYSDPGTWLMSSVSGNATSVLGEVGVLQQTLISDMCQRVADGDIRIGAVVGGDAGHRLRAFQKQGVEAPETLIDSAPDEVLEPARELKLEVEKRAGLDRATGYYGLIDSAHRARRGFDVPTWRDHLAEMYSGFSAIAARNPDAWRREFVEPEAIRDASPSNPMQSFPYTRRHTTSWSVDQAGALLVADEALAIELGISEDQWVYPAVAAECNRMVNVAERVDIGRSHGTELVARRVLDRYGAIGREIDLVDLYSCFPVAVELFAEALGLPDDRERTITGGMNLAGGPYNNYVVQSSIAMASALRRMPGAGSGLVTCVSGYMTKQAAAIWSNRRPNDGYVAYDETQAAEQSEQARSIDADASGPTRVVAHTVLHRPKMPATAIVVLETDDQRRTVAGSTDSAIIESMEQDDWIGRTVMCEDGTFRP